MKTRTLFAFTTLFFLLNGSLAQAQDPQKKLLNIQFSLKEHEKQNIKDAKSAGAGFRFKVESGKTHQSQEFVTDDNGQFVVSDSLLSENEEFSVTFLDDPQTWKGLTFSDGAGYTLAVYIGLSLRLHFVNNSDQIKVDAETQSYIDALKNFARIYRGHKIVITGHTDNVGDASANLDLSKRRALTMKNILVSQGMDANLIIADGKGESVPIAPNSSEDGRASNRRITVTLQ